MGQRRFLALAWGLLRSEFDHRPSRLSRPAAHAVGLYAPLRASRCDCLSLVVSHALAVAVCFAVARAAAEIRAGAYDRDRHLRHRIYPRTRRTDRRNFNWNARLR